MITEVASGDVSDAIDALDAACAVQDEWARTPPRDRGEILRRAFELITRRADDFAELMSLEMGKTVKEARELFEQFHGMITSTPGTPVDDLGKLSVFAGVREFPTRIKCASLAWHTMKAAVAHETDAPVSTE